jgi:hypothetical protein
MDIDVAAVSIQPLPCSLALHSVVLWRLFSIEDAGTVAPACTSIRDRGSCEAALLWLVRRARQASRCIIWPPRCMWGAVLFLFDCLVS